MSFTGFGVVVITTCGKAPSRAQASKVANPQDPRARACPGLAGLYADMRRNFGERWSRLKNRWNSNPA
jgi:hypothetical protein